MEEVILGYGSCKPVKMASNVWLQDTSVLCSYRKMAVWMNIKTKLLRFMIAIPLLWY